MTTDGAVDVSVIIPTHNSMSWLPQTLASALDQDGVSLEIVIVDNDSTDDTVAWARGLELSNLVLRFSPSVDVSRLIGVHAASGRYVAFLDHDDLWGPGKVRPQIAVLAERPDVVAVGTAFATFTDDPSEARLVLQEPLDEANLDEVRRARINPCHPSSVVMRRHDAQSILLDVLGLQPQDAAMLAQAARVGEIVRLEDEVTLVRELPGSQMRAGLLTWSAKRLYLWHVFEDSTGRRWTSPTEFARDELSVGDQRNLRTRYYYVMADAHRNSGNRLRAHAFRARATGRDFGLSALREARARFSRARSRQPAAGSEDG